MDSVVAPATTPRTIHDLVNDIAAREIARIKQAIADPGYLHAVVTAYRSLGRPHTAELFIGAVEEQRVAMAVTA